MSKAPKPLCQTLKAQKEEETKERRGRWSNLRIQKTLPDEELLLTQPEEAQILDSQEETMPPPLLNQEENYQLEPPLTQPTNKTPPSNLHSTSLLSILVYASMRLRNLPSVEITAVYRKLYSMYGNKVHHNDRTRLTGSIVQDKA